MGSVTWRLCSQHYNYNNITQVTPVVAGQLNIVPRTWRWHCYWGADSGSTESIPLGMHADAAVILRPYEGCTWCIRKMNKLFGYLDASINDGPSYTTPEAFLTLRDDTNQFM